MHPSLPLLALLLIACSSVNDSVGALSTQNGTSGTGGASGAAGASTDPGTSGSAGSTGLPACTRTDDSLVVSFETDGVSYACGTYHEDQEIAFAGQVNEVTGAEVTLSPLCGPEQKCSASHLTVQADGLVFPAPVGALVQVKVKALDGHRRELVLHHSPHRHQPAEPRRCHQSGRRDRAPVAGGGGQSAR